MKRILLFTALMGFACMPLMAAGPMSILGKVQRKGQEQAVANNLKQLATMLIMYAGDHNNRLPAAAGAAGLAELRPYGASDKLLIVPYDYGQQSRQRRQADRSQHQLRLSGQCGG